MFSIACVVFPDLDHAVLTAVLRTINSETVRRCFFFLQLLTIYVLDSNLLLHCYILKSTCGYKSNFEPFKPFNLFNIFCLSPKIWLVSMKKERSFHRTAIRATNATMQKRSRSDLQSTSQE